MSAHHSLPPAQQAIIQQFLSEYDQTQNKMNTTLQHTTTAAASPTPAATQFTSDEMSKIKQLLTTPSPSVTQLLQQAGSVNDVAERLKTFLRNPSNNSLTATATTNNSGISPPLSSSESAAPSSLATSTQAPSSVSVPSDSKTVTSQPESKQDHDGDVDMESISVPASSNSSAPMEVDSSASASCYTPILTGHLQSIEKDHSKTIDAILKNLLKLLSALKKNPNLLANRKFRCDNIAVKKFVTDVKGALEILKFVGYQTVELTEKKTPYLVIEESALATNETKAKLDAAIEAVTAKIADIERIAAGGASSTGAKPVASGEPKMCLGGCGFCGSAETEGYCSVCFKKKFLSGAAAASPSKPTPAKHNDPFVTPPKAGTAAAAAPVSSSSLSLGASSSLTSGATTNEVKCLKHCGRFGSTKYNGFCQVCYDKITAQGLKPPPKRWRCLFDGAMVKLRAVHRFNAGKKPVQENKSRCWVCSKKIGITGFECRCRYVFCAQHRYMEQHDCRYDIKSLHRKKLKKENELIMASKLENRL